MDFQILLIDFLLMMGMLGVDESFQYVYRWNEWMLKTLFNSRTSWKSRKKIFLQTKSSSSLWFFKRILHFFMIKKWILSICMDFRTQCTDFILMVGMLKVDESCQYIYRWNEWMLKTLFHSRTSWKSSRKTFFQTKSLSSLWYF